MALTGLEIYKHLPKTNCKKCGFPTCLAFAMALAQKKTSLDKCPDITEESKQALAAASQPPMATVIVGSGDKALSLGGETVLFRHEKTFVNPTGIAIRVPDTLEGKELEERLSSINSLEFERVGMRLGVNLVALANDSSDRGRFMSALKTVLEKTHLPVILMSTDPQTQAAALELCGTQRPLIYAMDAGNKDAFSDLAKKYSCPLAVRGKDLDETASLAGFASSKGVKDIVIETSAADLPSMMDSLDQIRRLALKKNFRPLGYPAMVSIGSGDIFSRIMESSAFICRYASLMILDSVSKEELLALVTLRLNIYTDPQKPIMMEPKLYEIGSPTKDSPVLVTTNFSLTYFTVAPEVESSRIPAYLLLTDSDGLSVLTAWAADKFTPEMVVSSIKKSGLEEKVSHKRLIIPGYVAVMTMKLKEESGWEVLVGPKEASGIPRFLKENWK